MPVGLNDEKKNAGYVPAANVVTNRIRKSKEPNHMEVNSTSIDRPVTRAICDLNVSIDSKAKKMLHRHSKKDSRKKEKIRWLRLAPIIFLIPTSFTFFKARAVDRLMKLKHIMIRISPAIADSE